MGAVWKWVLGATAVKILCFHLYYSTDLHVHHYWISLTGNKGWEEWYTDDSSEWSLDYPPAFALFQLMLFWILSYSSYFIKLLPSSAKIQCIGKAIDQILEFPPQPLDTPSIYILRTTVILSDILLLYGLCRYLRKHIPNTTIPLNSVTNNSFILMLMLGYMNAGLIMVDHIHFQYNGMMIGLLILFVSLVKEEKYVLSVVCYCTLVNLKHMFLGCGPIFVIYVIRRNCMPKQKIQWKILVGCLVTGLSTMWLFIGRYVMVGQLPVLLSRLFPFHRGLCHAYWAPNFWALYTALDKVLDKGVHLLGITSYVGHVDDLGSFTGGKIGVFQHKVLWTVTPRICSFLVLLSVIATYRIWKNPTTTNFTLSIAFSMFSMFMFGYHIHEKAIIPIIILIGLEALQSKQIAKLHFYVACIGHYSLTPLFYTIPENIIVIYIQLVFSIFEYCTLKQGLILPIVFVVVSPIAQFLLKLFLPQLPFLSLMVISLTCAIGLLPCFVYCAKCCTEPVPKIKNQ